MNAQRVRKAAPSKMLNPVAAIMLIQNYFMPFSGKDAFEPPDSYSSETRKRSWIFLTTTGLIDVTSGITEKGKFWVEAIMQVPLPVEVSKFEIPSGE